MNPFLGTSMACALLFFLTACGGGSGTPDGEEAKLLFRTGFEEGVSLDDPVADEGGVWYQSLRGEDGSGYAFPLKLWGTEGVFQLLVDSELDVGDYIRNRLVTTTGHDGRQTRVLRSEVLQADEPWTQDPYILMDAEEEGDLYVSYWLKLPKNLPEVLGDGGRDDGWCTFFEWKTAGDYRIAAYVYIEDGKPIWFVHGDNVARDDYGEYEEYWSIENREIPVPQGEWMKVEFFWHRSTGEDGRFWWAVDGRVVADYHGPNKIEAPIDRIMLFTVYSGKYPLVQEVDDLEIWDGFPCGEGKSCYGR